MFNDTQNYFLKKPEKALIQAGSVLSDLAASS